MDSREASSAVDDPLLQSILFLLVLINPFLVSVYLVDLIRQLEFRLFVRVILRAMSISAVAYCLFALGGDRIFEDVLQVRFAAFQVFGGIIFVMVAIRSILLGGQAIMELRGDPEHLAGAIAMPFMIGPATLSASILIGASHPFWKAAIGIVIAVASTTAALLVLKAIHDRVRHSHSRLIERYMDIVGRISALLIGTIAVDMIFRGIDGWLSQ